MVRDDNEIFERIRIMKKLISFKLAGKITIAIIVLLIIFHILVLLGVVPSNIVWGDQMVDNATILKHEIICLIGSFIFLAIILEKLNQNKITKFKKLYNPAFWFIYVYFVICSIVKLTSAETLEKLIFIPVTVILSVLLFRLAIEK